MIFEVIILFWPGLKKFHLPVCTGSGAENTVFLPFANIGTPGRIVQAGTLKRCDA